MKVVDLARVTQDVEFVLVAQKGKDNLKAEQNRRLVEMLCKHNWRHGLHSILVFHLVFFLFFIFYF